MCGHMVNVLLLELFELQIALRFADSEVEGVFNCLISICSLRYHVPSALCLLSTQYSPNFFLPYQLFASSLSSAPLCHFTMWNSLLRLSRGIMY